MTTYIRSIGCILLRRLRGQPLPPSQLVARRPPPPPSPQAVPKALPPPSAARLVAMGAAAEVVAAAAATRKSGGVIVRRRRARHCRGERAGTGLLAALLRVQLLPRQRAGAVTDEHEPGLRHRCGRAGAVYATLLRGRPTEFTRRPRRSCADTTPDENCITTWRSDTNKRGAPDVGLFLANSEKHRKKE